MSNVEIAGVGLHPFGRFEDAGLVDLGVAAVRSALAEAGTTTFQAAYCGTAYGGVATGHRVLGALGHTREDYTKAGDHWTPLLKQDMAVATLYGQLFANAGELPRKP